MDYTIVTYGAGEVLATTFNAVAALINSETGSLYQPLVRFALIIGLVWATASMVYGDKAKFLNNWVVPFYLILSLFFAPTCKVHIHDPVTGYRMNVDNVPWGLGATAGVISQIGNTVTKKIEMTFSLPDDLKYHKTGSVMASNLIANARKFRITNSELKETMKSFVNQCVVYDALLGQKYTFDDLKNSDDIWGLVSADPSPARAFVFKAPGRGAHPRILTCAQGARELEPYLTQNTENAFQFFERKIFGENNRAAVPLPAGQQLKQYLPGAFNYMTNMAKSATEHMMQQVMIHTVVDSIENKSTELGNAPNFAVRRAYLQQRANQENLAGIAAQKLVAMKNVMEALIYAAFIFILPLALLPLGWTYISRWVGLVMWVQLWPPLYAILNFIMNISVRSKGIGVISDPAGTGITIANSVGFIDLHADMAAQAGFMSIAVGSLAYALVKGGAASFVHLASHMAGPAMSAASSATESMMSGNYSFGNVSQGGISAHNTSFGQQNESASYNSGSFTQNDGVVSRATSADGDHIVSIANSNLRSGVNFSESLSNSYTEQANQAAQASQTQMISAAEAQADAYRQTLDLASHQSTTASNGEHYGMGTSAGQNTSLMEANNLTEKFAKEHGLTKEAASQLVARASASLETGVGFNVLGNGISAKGSISAGASHSLSNIDRDTWSAAQDYVKQHGLSDTLNRASQATQDMKYSEMSDTGQRLSDGISGSLEKSHQYREESNKSLQQSESFSKMAAQTKQNASSINANMNQEYVGWLQEQSLPNSSGAMGIHEAETILSSRPDMNHQYQQRFIEDKTSSYMGNQGLANNASDISAGHSNSSITNGVSDGAISSVSNQASGSGMGDVFSIGTSTKSAATEKISHLQDQIAEQTELMEKEMKIREGGFGT